MHRRQHLVCGNACAGLLQRQSSSVPERLGTCLYPSSHATGRQRLKCKAHSLESLEPCNSEALLCTPVNSCPSSWRRFAAQQTAAYGRGSFDAASELLTTPPRQPPPPALRRRGAAASPPSEEQPAGVYGPARRGSLGRAEGGTGSEGGGVQMGFSSDWDPSAVLVGVPSQPFMRLSPAYSC